MARTSWTEDKIRALISTCESRYEFKRTSQSAYNAARRLPGLLDEYFGYTKRQWDEQSASKDASECSSRKEFSNRPGGAYQWARKNGRLDTYFPKAKPWTAEAVRAESRKYSTKSEFMNGSSAAYQAAYRLGILNDLMDNQFMSWKTEEAVREEASKHACRASFQTRAPGAYSAALRTGILDDLYDRKYMSWGTEEELRAEASKYECKSDFEAGSPGAYYAALRMGIINTLGFKPGKYGYNSSKPGYVYICDLRLTDSNDGVMFGITNQASRKRYRPADQSHISNWTAYLFLDGTVALAIETELKRRFLAKKITSKQSPLSTKLGTSGEIVTGVQRSIVEVALLDINSKFDGAEHW